MTVIGKVAADVADGTVLSNTAAVFSDTPDGNPLNNLATVAATVTHAPPSASPKWI